MKNQNGSVEVLIGIMAALFCIGFILLATFLTIDWKIGEHGRLTLTAVDKNLFGTYTIYAKNSESMSGNEMIEITYCIDADNEALANRAKEAVGKQNVKLVYPDRRIGFYWLDKCGSAPIKDIVLSE